MALKLITAPAAEPITLAEAKRHLNVDHSDDDILIATLVKAVRQHIDGRNGWLGRALVKQTWELTLDNFPCREVRIPIPPLQSIVQVAYDDTDGNEQVIAASNYEVDTISEPGWLVPKVGSPWPVSLMAINAVRIRFMAGYSQSVDSPPDFAANVPGPIKAAILLMLGTLYQNRETVVIGQTVIQLPWAAEALLGPYRVWSH